MPRGAQEGGYQHHGPSPGSQREDLRQPQQHREAGQQQHRQKRLQHLVDGHFAAASGAAWALFMEGFESGNLRSPSQQQHIRREVLCSPRVHWLLAGIQVKFT